MRLTATLSYKLVKELPYRLRGKNRKVPEPTKKDLSNMRNDFAREQRNMLLLRHPYLTVEQSHGHMPKVNKMPNIILNKYKKDNEKFDRHVTYAQHLSHLNTTQNWDKC